MNERSSNEALQNSTDLGYSGAYIQQSAAGFHKNRGEVDAQRTEVCLEGESELQVSAGGIEPRIHLRLSVAPRPGDRPHIDQQATTIELTIGQIARLAQFLNGVAEQFGPADNGNKPSASRLFPNAVRRFTASRSQNEAAGILETSPGNDAAVSRRRP